MDNNGWNWYWWHENMPEAKNGPFLYESLAKVNIREWSDDQFEERMHNDLSRSL
jgi:hypothetical protein